MSCICIFGNGNVMERERKKENKHRWDESDWWGERERQEERDWAEERQKQRQIETQSHQRREREREGGWRQQVYFKDGWRFHGDRARERCLTLWLVHTRQEPTPSPPHWKQEPADAEDGPLEVKASLIVESWWYEVKVLLPWWRQTVVHRSSNWV